MAKVRDYAKLAHDIKDAIGEENITSAAHCATRLRLVLKESPSAETTAQISSMPGVIQVMEKGGQYQIVIGTHAQDVYEEMAKLLYLDASQQPEVKQGLLNRVIATMSAVFAPFCLHPGGRRPGAGLPDHRHHFCADFRRYRHLRGAQLYFLDAVHLFAGADRHYSVQALQL